jgi:uncharacterized membrane protein YwzB
MVTKFVERFTQLKDHHQVLFGFIVFLAIAIFTWAVQKICDEIFIGAKNKKIVYLLIIILSILTLSLANYFVKYIV